MGEVETAFIYLFTTLSEGSYLKEKKKKRGSGIRPLTELLIIVKE